MVAPQQQFCVRWNSYHSNLQSAFPKLLTSEHFVDVTLACDNGLIKCHKVVLSACSSYFENILIQNPCQHPTIVLKDMKCREVQTLVNFMYKGEVNVTQEDLASLLKAAEGLQIRGLTGSEQCLNQMNVLSHPSPIPATSTVTAAASLTSTATPCPPLATSTSGQQTLLVPNATPATETISPTSELMPTDLKIQPAIIKVECEPQIVKKKKLEINDDKSDNSNHSSTGSYVQDDNDDKLEIKEEPEHIGVKLEASLKGEEIGYNDDDLDMDYYDRDEDGNENNPGTSDNGHNSDYNPAANVSCLYAKRIRRSETELRQAADCITRGQTFQNVSDQFNIPISTIRFFMARKGILPRRKRGRSSSVNTMGGFHSASMVGGNDRSGNTSPIGPPFHIAHYKLPELRPALN